MATPRNKRKLAAINKDNHEDHLKNNSARDTNVTKIQEVYIIQVSEELERNVTKKLCQEFCTTENLIFGALTEPGELFLNPQLRGHSGPVPETSRISNGENQETNEDRSQNDTHSELSVSLSQYSQECSSGETTYNSNAKLS